MSQRLSCHQSPGVFRAVLVVALLSWWGCTLLLDTNATQCRHDSDCLSFSKAVCDVPRGVCVSASPDIDAAVPDAAARTEANPDALTEAPIRCQGVNGCFTCAPTNDHEFLSTCTDSTCVPFDNHARLTNLADDGSLKPLP
jgi:hypothetical protein